MSISPPSDIVLDVVNAAKPAKRAVATQRLTQMAQGAGADAVSFSKTLEAAAPKVAAKVVATKDVAAKEVAAARAEPAKSFLEAEKRISEFNNDLLVTTRRVSPNSPDTPLKQANKQLESVFLQGIINSMLSAQEDKLFGKGIEGGYWKSFMAEAIANQVVKGKGLGIAESLGSKQTGRLPPTASLQPATDTGADYKNFFQKIFMEELTSPTNS